MAEQREVRSPSITILSAPAMDAASKSLCSVGTSISTSPTTTKVGAVILSISRDSILANWLFVVSKTVQARAQRIRGGEASICRAVSAPDFCFESVDSICQILDPAVGVNIEAVKYLHGVVVGVLRTDIARHALYVLPDHND